MMLAALILFGLMAYGAIGGCFYMLIAGKYGDVDHKPEYSDGTPYNDGAILGGALWPILGVAVYLAAYAHVEMRRTRRKQKEQDELLKKEGLL